MNNISQKAMLISLSISQWAGRKHDKKISQEVADHHGTNSDAGRYNKSLIAKDALKAIQKAANTARTFHYENTLPWSNDGARILPAANFTAYSEKMRELKADFDAAVQDFVSNYDQYVDQARISLNGLFNYEDYPDRWTIEKKFNFATDINPLPDAADFRVNINQAETDRIKADIQARLESTMKSAMRDLWDRLYKSVSHMVDKLKNTDAVFRDSLVNNICELCGLLPRLNITDDPELENLRREIESALCVYDPADLRTDKQTRKQAADEAAAIMEKMAGYMGA